MKEKNEDIFSQAMSLPPADRALLADLLLDSLEPSNKDEIDQLWAEEAERRVGQIESGGVKPIPREV